MCSIAMFIGYPFFPSATRQLNQQKYVRKQHLLIDQPQPTKSRTVATLKKYKPDVVINANPVTQPHNSNPYKTMRQITDGTLNMLEAMRVTDVKRFVMCSGWDTYGDIPQAELPITEWTHQHPSTIHSTATIMAEYATRSYAELYGMKAVIARFASIYGTTDDPQPIGEIIDCMKNNKLYILEGEGTQKNEYLYVDDAVEAMLKLALHTENMDYPWEHFVVGTAQPNSLLHVVRVAQSVSKFPLEFAPTDKVFSNYKSSIGYIKRRVGWQPKVSLREGLQKCYGEKHV